MIYKSEDNPYTLQFSYIPPQYISRKSLIQEVVGDYKKKVPTFRGHFLTGVRGSGKSVMMAEIYETMNREKDWVAVDIEDPKSDIVDSLARGLYRVNALRAMFVRAKIDISILGLGVSIEDSKAVATNASDVLDLMLKVLKKNKKKVLVTIDEVTYCDSIASFSHTLSSYARAGYDIFLLMTGLRENIRAIKNDKSLTFLYRAKEHILEPLNTTAMIADYMKVFGIKRDDAEQMAWFTKGYSFAFQVLGYIYWEALSACGSDYSRVDKEALKVDFDQYMDEFVYDKIWSELPGKEKEILKAISSCDSSKVKDIRNLGQISSSEFSVYRERLMEKGLIDGREYGTIRLTLPRFSDFVNCKM